MLNSRSIKTQVISLIRILVGLIFIFSAISKIWGIDHFEVYIFSQNFFGFDFSSLIARLIISGELFIGVMLILNLYFEKILMFTFFLITFFTFFLIYAIFKAPDENCNCFGNILPLNAVESIFKNIILIILLFVIRQNKTWGFKYRRIIFISTIILTVSLPLIISSPDFIYYKIFNTTEITEKEQYLELDNNTLPYKQGKKLIAFYSMKCKYCLLAAKKISIISKRTGIKDNILYYFFGEPENLPQFWQKSNSTVFPHAIISFDELMHIAKGKLPAILLVENGKIMNRYSYRTFTEDVFAEFFTE
ncbi:MAG: DoxX family protein [Bacteroidales bacterium]|nr:DoxX family protein [Bacteroidales bacterium]